MKIIIVGLGETGRSLVKMLDRSGYDITVIDKDRKKMIVGSLPNHLVY